MNRHVNVPLNQEIIDSLDILILTRIRRSKDCTNANRVLITQAHRLLWINDIPVRCAVDQLLVNLEVARGLFPADLDCRGHNEVWVFGTLALSAATQLPALLHGQDGEHDGLGGADGRGADGLAAVGHVEEVADHGDAAVVHFDALRVLFVVDEVLGEGFGHELFRFILLRHRVNWVVVEEVAVFGLTM
jgi:hypothetical protein